MWYLASAASLTLRPPPPPPPPPQANLPCYYAVDTSRTLGSQLAGKVIIEFPVFVVCLPGQVRGRRRREGGGRPCWV